MSVEMSIIPQRHVAYFRLSGVMTTQAGEEAFQAYVQHPLFDPTMPLLTNSAAVNGVESGFIQIMAAVVRLRPVFARFNQPVNSIIYTTNDRAFGLARVLQQVAEPMTSFRFLVTQDQADALQHVGQPEREFEKFDSALKLPRRPTGDLALPEVSSG